MVIYCNQTDLELRESFKGGKGGGFSRFYMPPNSNDANGPFTMIAENILDPGSSIGYHLHEQDDEVFFILSGFGVYTEDGKDFEVNQGDVMLLRRGHSHGLQNTGREPLRLLAVIAR